MVIFVRYRIIFFNIRLIFYFHLKLENRGEVYEKFVLKAHSRLPNLFLISAARAKLYRTFTLQAPSPQIYYPYLFQFFIALGLGIKMA